MYHDSETYPYQPTEQDEEDYREWIEYLEGRIIVPPNKNG